nr:hypothetical protein [Tanacetum cinerariifolium]
MSNSEDFIVTYTKVSSLFKDLSDIESSRVVVYRYDRLLMHPPSPDYVPGPKHPSSPDYVPSHEHPPSSVYIPYVPEPAYPEFMPLEDDVLPAEEQPLLASVSPTTKDEEEEEFFGDDADDKEEDEDEEEHLAPANSVPPPAYQTPLSGTPPLLPIPLPTSSPPLLLPSTDRREVVLEVTLPTRKRLYIAIEPRFEVEECSSAPTASPTRGFKAYYGFVGTLDFEIRSDPDREIGYGITHVCMDPNEIAEEIPMTDVAELS